MSEAKCSEIKEGENVYFRHPIKVIRRTRDGRFLCRVYDREVSLPETMLVNKVGMDYLDERRTIELRRDRMDDKKVQEGLDRAYQEAGHNAYFGEGFKAGVRFAENVSNSASVSGTKARCDEPDHVLIRMPDGSDYGMKALEAFHLANDIRAAAVIARIDEMEQVDPEIQGLINKKFTELFDLGKERSNG